MRKVFKKLGLCLLCMAATSVYAQESVPADQTDAVTPSPRIVGGFLTSIALAPATVALLRTNRVQLDGDLFQAQFCGGTIIAPRWVLTAAHCVLDTAGNIATPDSILVLTGSADLESPINQPIGVQRIIQHPEYRSAEEGRDIALLQLEYDALVEPIALDTLPIGVNEKAFIAGWGALNSRDGGRKQSYPKQLRGAYVDMTSGTTCGELHPAYSGFIDDTNLCAGVVEGGKDSCQGDSGGPLYRVDVNENRMIAITGITSWGVSCGLAENPGVYTNVAAYTQWIQDNIRSADGQPSNDGSLPANQGSIDLSLADGQSSADNDGSQGDDDNSLLSGATGLPLLAILALALRRRTRRHTRHKG